MADLRIDKIACSDPLDCAATEVTELVPGTTIHYQIRVGQRRALRRPGRHGERRAARAALRRGLELRRRAGAGAARRPCRRPPPCTTATTSTTSRVPAPCRRSPLVDGLDGARAVAVSPDGLNLYVAGATDNAVAIFRRDLRNGTRAVHRPGGRRRSGARCRLRRDRSGRRPARGLGCRGERRRPARLRHRRARRRRRGVRAPGGHRRPHVPAVPARRRRPASTASATSAERRSRPTASTSTRRRRATTASASSRATPRPAS